MIAHGVIYSGYFLQLAHACARVGNFDWSVTFAFAWSWRLGRTETVKMTYRHMQTFQGRKNWIKRVGGPRATSIFSTYVRSIPKLGVQLLIVRFRRTCL